MRIKYIIHRSKSPFARQKEAFRKLINFFSGKYSGLRFVDKGLRFCAEYGESTIDFDFGYVNMRYRDFSGYHTVISQQAFTILNRDLDPGVIAFPNKSAMMRINGDNSMVRVYDRVASYENRMDNLFDAMRAYEQSTCTGELQRFVRQKVCPDSSGIIEPLDKIQIKKHAAFVESNTFFYPSKLKNAEALLKQGEERLAIPDLREHLQTRFDGVNCESKQMIENCGSRLITFALGLDKPYEGTELPYADRFGVDIEAHQPTYNDRKVTYFLAMLLDYCFEKDCVLA